MPSSLHVINPDPGFYSKTSCIQLTYAVWVNMVTIGLGLAHGFPAVQLPQLLSPDSDILVSIEEVSWIASVLILFSPIGCLLAGFMMDKFGRRIPILSCQIPMSIGWLYMGLAQNARSIIIGRAVTGVGCGMAMGAPRVYTSEISLSNMRGLLGAFPNMFMALGVTIQAGMGAFFKWKQLCYICCIFNIVLFLSLLLLKESPHYLLVNSTVEKAREALTYFRSEKYNIDREMDELIEFKTDNRIRRLTNREKIKEMCSPASCKPFIIAMTYVATGCLSGVQMVTTWTINILMVSNSSFDVHAGNFVISLTRVIFGAISSVLLFYVGRRPIGIFTALGVGLSSLIMGIYLSNFTNPSIIPQIILMAYTAFACLGFQCLPFLLMSEMFPVQIRGMLTGISLTVTCIMVFIAIKSFPYLHAAVGTPNMFYIFAGGSILAVIYLTYALPETHGLTLKEIEEYFRGVRPTLVSDRSLIGAQLSASRNFTKLKDRSTKIVEIESYT